jgi:hypothetical protein
MASAFGSDETLKNRFDDPFFQLSSAAPACPEPRGPLMTEEEAISDTHHRLERGQRCYLEKRCRYSSSYQYDPEIAHAIQAAARDGRFKVPRESSLWILVQGRRVFAYGCVPSGYRAGSLRDQLRVIPDVEVAVEDVRVGPRGTVGYRTR